MNRHLWRGLKMTENDREKTNSDKTPSDSNVQDLTPGVVGSTSGVYPKQCAKAILFSKVV